MIKVLLEDEHILVVLKPVNMPSQKDFSRTPDLMTAVQEHIKTKPYLIHRLDRHVAGPVVFAKTKQGASELNKQLTSIGFKKKYLAVSYQEQHKLEDKSFVELLDYITKENKMAKVISLKEYQSLTLEAQKKYKEAKLKYRFFKKNETKCLYEIDLITGRFHQIRAQLSSHGLTIIGDPKYGVKEGAYIGLQCVQLGFYHPITKQQISINTYHQLGPFEDFEVKQDEYIQN